jgi:beta-glucosidase
MAAFLIGQIVRVWSGDDSVAWFEARTPPPPGAAVQAMRIDVDGFLGPWDFAPELGAAQRTRAADQRITLAARRVLALRQRLDSTDRRTYEVDRKANQALAVQAAREAIVLLRNDGLLPLLTSPGLRVAVLGPHSGELVAELGQRVEVVQHSTGADRVRLVTADTGVRLDLVFDLTEWQPGGYVLEAGCLRMTAEHQADGTALVGELAAGVYLTVDPADQTISTTTDRTRATPLHWETIVDGAAHAAELARNADIVVLAVGDRPTADDNRGQLRTTMNLPAQQERLVREVRAANANSVLTVFSTHPYALAWEDSYLPAILWTIPGGAPTRRAVAEVLFGEQSPAGRLPQTWYRSDSDVTDEPDRDTVAAGWTYMYTRHQPLYAFGHGLTYTTFAYGPLRMSGSRLRDDEEIAVSIQVRNTGFRKCAEVVQLYTRQLGSAVAQPNKQLRDFQKITLAAQSSRTVNFRLRTSDLAFWEVRSQDWVVETGTYEVCVGRSSEDIAGVATITVHGTTVEGRKLADGPVPASSADLSAGIAIVDTDAAACPVISPVRPGAWLAFRRCSTAGARSWGVVGANTGERPVTVRLHADAHDGPVLSLLTLPPTVDGHTVAVTADLPQLPESCDLFVVCADTGLRLSTITFATS